MLNNIAYPPILNLTERKIAYEEHDNYKQNFNPRRVDK
jgi:hypothetical protein